MNTTFPLGTNLARPVNSDPLRQSAVMPPTLKLGFTGKEMVPCVPAPAAAGCTLAASHPSRTGRGDVFLQDFVSTRACLSLSVFLWGSVEQATFIRHLHSLITDIPIQSWYELLLPEFIVLWRLFTITYKCARLEILYLVLAAE